MSFFRVITIHFSSSVLCVFLCYIKILHWCLKRWQTQIHTEQKKRDKLSAIIISSSSSFSHSFSVERINFSVSRSLFFSLLFLLRKPKTHGGKRNEMKQKKNKKWNLTNVIQFKSNGMGLVMYYNMCVWVCFYVYRRS